MMTRHQRIDELREVIHGALSEHLEDDDTTTDVLLEALEAAATGIALVIADGDIASARALMSACADKWLKGYETVPTAQRAGARVQ